MSTAVPSSATSIHRKYEYIFTCFSQHRPSLEGSPTLEGIDLHTGGG
jgi:hypothetical protein